jgi:hypothetical protein
MKRPNNTDTLLYGRFGIAPFRSALQASEYGASKSNAPRRAAGRCCTCPRRSPQQSLAVTTVVGDVNCQDIADWHAAMRSPAAGNFTGANGVADVLNWTPQAEGAWPLEFVPEELLRDVRTEHLTYESHRFGIWLPDFWCARPLSCAHLTARMQRSLCCSLPRPSSSADWQPDTLNAEPDTALQAVPSSLFHATRHCSSCHTRLPDIFVHCSRSVCTHSVCDLHNWCALHMLQRPLPLRRHAVLSGQNRRMKGPDSRTACGHTCSKRSSSTPFSINMCLRRKERGHALGGSTRPLLLRPVLCRKLEHVAYQIGK